MALDDLPTPCLLLDRAVVERNIRFMEARAERLGVRLRPHMKTAKSADVGRLFAAFPPPITVSTLAEAEYFAGHGFTDIMYAVGMVPAKLPRLAALAERGVQLGLLVDSVAMTDAILEFIREREVSFDLMIEVDADGHRSGLSPHDPQLLAIARRVADRGRARLRGVLAHAGDAYNCRSWGDLEAHAELERSQCVQAAEFLRTNGFLIDEVSVGSTPTAIAARSLDGVTEARPGNFVFMDLFQAGLGVCEPSDIGVSVLASITGHDPEHNRLFIDAGALALSKDLARPPKPLTSGTDCW